METTNVLMDEVVEVTEEIVNESSGNFLKTVGVAGLVILGGILTTKYVIKPMMAKFKKKKEDDSKIEKEDLDKLRDEAEEVEFEDENENE